MLFSLLPICLCPFSFAHTHRSITSLVALYHSPYPELPASANPTPTPTPTSSSSPPYLSNFSAARYSGLPALLPILMYSFIFHHSTGGVLQPLKRKPQHTVRVLTAVVGVCVACYALLGISAGVYFGTGVQQIGTLNW
jgi:hypothetical protein